MIRSFQGLQRFMFQASVLSILMAIVLLPAPTFAAVQKLGDPIGTNTHPHNLSSAGASAVKADIGETDQICIFCHTPHNASSNGPLWNRPDITTAVGGGSFPLYAKLGNLVIDDAGVRDLSTYGDGVTQYPNGATRLCLSCHDGVTAIGTVLSATGGTDIAPSLGSMTVESPSMVIDLSTSHPVSFVYDSNVMAFLQDKPLAGTNAYKQPTAGILDDQSRMQCTACHDPHVDTNDGTYLLPMWRNYTGTEDVDYLNTCSECHVGGPTSAGLIDNSLTYPTHDLHTIP